MEEDKSKAVPCVNKGICTDRTRRNAFDFDPTNSDPESIWQSPSKLKQEVQTIIDIMSPPVSYRFGSYNTSSEADNEESIFTNSKVSALAKCNEGDDSQKTDAPDISRDDTNASAVADINTTNMSDLEEVQRLHCPLAQTETLYPPCICPPPLLPANVCINSECLCPQMATLFHAGALNFPHPYGGEEMARVSNIRSQECQGRKNSLLDWLRDFVSKHSKCEVQRNNCEDYYKMNVKRSGENPPRQVVFELVGGIPKGEFQAPQTTKKTSTKFAPSKEKKNKSNQMMQGLQQHVSPRRDVGLQRDDIRFEKVPVDPKKSVGRTTYFDPDGRTRVDVYYFDHGNSTHFRTTDSPPLVCTEELSEKTERTATRFWAEIFGTIHIGVSFCTSFILQFFRFLLYSILRPLTIGILQLSSDYFFKPLLATLFNGLVQPVLIFFYNTATSLRDLCDPLAEGTGFFLREIAVLLRAIRLVEINKGACKCDVNSKCDKNRCKKRCHNAC